MCSDLDYVFNNADKVLKYTPDCTIDPIRKGIVDRELAVLIVRDKDGERRGFLVYSVQDTGKMLVLFAVAGWMDGIMTTPELEGVVECIDELARSRGCSRIEFKTTRQGWLRKLARFGYSQTPYISIGKDIYHGC